MLTSNWGLTRVSQPAEEPVTLVEIKDQLDIDQDITDFDQKLTLFNSSARALIERITGRVMAPCTWLKTQDRVTEFIEIPSAPITSIDEFSYLDSAGDKVVLVEDTDFVFSAHRLPPVLQVITSGHVTNGRIDAVQIAYTAGYPSGELDEILHRALLMTVDAWWDDSSQAGGGTANSAPPDLPGPVQMFLRASGLGDYFTDYS